MSNEISNYDDVIYSRNVIERIEELEGELEEAFQARSEERRDELEEELDEV